MAMCLQALGVKCDEDEVAQVMGCHPLRGATWEDAAACAQHYGCRIELVIPATLGLVKNWTDQGDPAMIGWNPEGRPWSHASVIFDVDDVKVHVADPNCPDPTQVVREVPFREFYGKWSEKWPKYMVRRPAMRITREITSDGKQVMASERTMDKKTANMADRFLPLRILRRHIYAEKLAQELAKAMGDDLCRKVFGAIATKHHYPIEVAGAPALNLLHDFLRHIDVDELLDAMARSMSDEDALPVFDKVADTFGIRLASQRSNPMKELTVQQFADGLADARRASTLRTEYTRPGMFSAEALQRRLAGFWGLKGPSLDPNEQHLIERGRSPIRGQKEMWVLNVLRGPHKVKLMGSPDKDKLLQDAQVGGLVPGRNLTVQARYEEGEEVSMEEMVKTHGPEWKTQNDKYEDVVDKDKGPGDKKEKKAARSKALWRYNKITGYWTHERNVTDETEHQWLARFKKDDPEVDFVISKSKPKGKPKRASGGGAKKMEGILRRMKVEEAISADADEVAKFHKTSPEEVKKVWKKLVDEGVLKKVKDEYVRTSKKASSMLSLTEMAQRLGRWAEGEEVSQEEMAEQAGPEWKKNTDKHEDVVDKGKGPGDKKDKKAGERQRLSWRSEKPKTATLSPETLKESFSLNDKAASALAEGITNARTGSQVSRVLNLASLALDAHAVGTIKDDRAWDNFYGKVAAVYAEMGDPEATTLIYDTGRKAFFVGSWSTWVQNHEAEGNKVASTDFSGTEKGQLVWL